MLAGSEQKAHSPALFQQSHLKLLYQRSAAERKMRNSIVTQINMCIKDNRELHRKLDALDPTKMVEAVTQAAASSYQKGYQKANPFVKSSNSFQGTSQSQPSTSSQYG